MTTKTEQDEKRELILIRPAVSSDLNLIYATWLRGLYYDNPWFKEIDRDLFFYHYEIILKKILQSPKVTTLVASLKEDPDVVLGYSVSQAHVLHWVFIKPQWRKIGLAKDLIPCNITEVSHLTSRVMKSKPQDQPCPHCGHLKKHRPQGVKFNPFLNL